jgi:hypothetical protein
VAYSRSRANIVALETPVCYNIVKNYLEEHLAFMDKLIKRSEQKVEYTWDTTHIYPSDEAWLAAFDEVAAAIDNVATYAGGSPRRHPSCAIFSRFPKKFRWTSHESMPMQC